MDLPTLVMELSRRLYDAERRINNLIRPARVVEVDTKKALVKVAYGLDEQDQDVVSGWIPWSPSRAGEINKWEPPSKDEQVLMVNLSGEIGPMSMITSSLWSGKYKPPSDKKAEKKTTVRENKKNPDGTEEPDDNKPAYISSWTATEDDAVESTSAQDKYKNPTKVAAASQNAKDASFNYKQTSGGVTNQQTHTPNSDVYDNPGGGRFVNCARIAYAKKAGSKDQTGSTQVASSGAPSGDSFSGFDGGVTT
jgi:phage baseplate assembly protein gpV